MHKAAIFFYFMIILSCGFEEKDDKESDLLSPIPIPDPVEKSAGTWTKPDIIFSGSEITALILYAMPAQSQIAPIANNKIQNPYSITDMNIFLEYTFHQLNTLYKDASALQHLTVNSHQSIDYIEYGPTWVSDLIYAIMNQSSAGSTSFSENQKAMLADIKARRDAANADIVLFWRPKDDGSTVVNGAAKIGASADDAMAQFTFNGFLQSHILAHEIGHLEGAKHEDAYVEETLTSYSVDNELSTDKYRTIMASTKILSQEERSLDVLYRFTSPNVSLTGDVLCRSFKAAHIVKAAPNTCSFSTASSIGDEEHNSLSIINNSAPTFSNFR